MLFNNSLTDCFCVSEISNNIKLSALWWGCGGHRHRLLRPELGDAHVGMEQSQICQPVLLRWPTAVLLVLLGNTGPLASRHDRWYVDPYCINMSIVQI